MPSIFSIWRILYGLESMLIVQKEHLILAVLLGRTRQI